MKIEIYNINITLSTLKFMGSFFFFLRLILVVEGTQCSDFFFRVLPCVKNEKKFRFMNIGGYINESSKKKKNKSNLL